MSLTTAAEPARHHIATLQGAGWSQRTIAASAGVSDTLIRNILNGQEHCLTAVVDLICAINPETTPRTSYRGASPFVSRTGTFRRIQALLAMGWTHRHLEEITGIQTGALMAKNRPRVRLATHDTIAALYRQLATTPGPSASSRRRALARGYVSPAGWDDIDNDPEPFANEYDQAHAADVDEVVVLRILAGEVLPATRAEREQVVASWHLTGRPLADLERLGWKPERYRTSAGQGDAA